MPTHNLSVWITLIKLLTMSLIRVLFIILPSAPEGRTKAKRKGWRERKRKKQSVESPASGISCVFLFHAIQCLREK